MRTKEQLAQELETLQGWKSIRPYSFWNIFFSVKKILKKYVHADWRGIADAIVLRREKHEDFHYVVTAFSTKGAIPEDVIALLKERVAQFPLGSVRYESSGPGGTFTRIVTDDGSYYSDDYHIHRQAEDLEGVYITVLADDSIDKINCPWIVYAHFEGGLYVYSVNAKCI